VREGRKQLGDLLVERGMITQEQLDEALERQRTNGEPLGQMLVDSGYITEVDLLKMLAEQLGLDFVDVADYKIDLSAAAMLPYNVAKKNLVLPLDFDDNKLIVATADPTNVFIFDDLRIMTGFEIKPVVCAREDLLEIIERFGQNENVLEEASEEEETGSDKVKAAKEAEELAEEAPIVKLVNLIINQACEEGASDIHIEPQENDMRIRYRVDGVLQEVMRSPKKIQAGLISRLKIMSDMNIAERRIPQDGRIGLVVGNRAVDFRVASLPSVYGEQMVLRILEKESIMLTLEDLGFFPETLTNYKKSIGKPYGTILVTGPTGSGKSTTLYATLNVLNVPEKNIMTIEDPVEYRLAGLSQMQVNTKAGMTFAAGLRAVLRGDPDCLLVGEIRDRETALIAIESALTGHLVLSTLHTNDAPSAITRLTEMGVEPFLIASAIDCVLAQRLGRRLCKNCKEKHTMTAQEVKNLGFDAEDKEYEFYKPVGCPKCNNTGYKGRMGIHEVMVMSQALGDLAVKKASSDELMRMAIKEGMNTLRQDGFNKALAGQTSLEEVVRVVA
jgi:type IV pilus assembly protein PilB